MVILIPTLGRVTEQPTWDFIPNEWRDRTYLVCPPEEEDEHHRRDRQVLVCPINGQEGKTIGDVRQWMMEHSPDPHILMLDDDLRFSTWSELGKGRMRPADKVDMNKFLKMAERGLKSHAHLAIQPRAGANHVWPAVSREVGRACTAWGVDRDVLAKEGIKFNRLGVMEDFDVVLGLLSKGYPNFIICNYQWDQKGCNTSGGCSTYRTPEVQKASAEKLAELWPNFVKVVQKETKGRWKGMDTRYDVRVQWRKAYESFNRT